jgi:peptidoglycan/xylan/chitin deacetylase (PgdA/CDA1 family)
MTFLYATILLILVLLIINLIARFFDGRLRVLMYHKVSANGEKDFLTITRQDLATQFRYLQQQGYTPLLFSDLVAYMLNKKPLPPKPVLITFDDGYQDNYTNMYPLLKQYGMKANIFLVAGWVRDGEPPLAAADNVYLDVKEIAAMDSRQVEFGLHSMDHKSYGKLSPEEVRVDIAGSKRLLQEKGISFQPCLAFPYGDYPRNSSRRQMDFFEVLAANQLLLSFRIGNRLNRLPLRNPLLVQRLDIRGDESFQKFVRLLKYGKKPFG